VGGVGGGRSIAGKPLAIRPPFLQDRVTLRNKNPNNKINKGDP